MKPLLVPIAICAAVGLVVLAAQTPTQPAPQTPRPQPATADPYANNPNAGAAKFPLAAPAGTDSNARRTAPADAMNQGPFDPATWKYGPAFTPPAGTKVWNP